MDSTGEQTPLARRGFARPDLVNGLILFGIPCVLFLPTLVRNQIPYFMDIVAQFYPVRIFAARLLHQGELPLWNPTYYCGVPFLANPQWGILYPGNVLFFLFSAGWSFTATLVLHTVVGSWGVYLLSRHFTKNRYAAMLGALLYLLGGYAWAHYAFGAFLLTLAWVPFVYFWFERYMETQRSVYALAAGAGLALQILSGTPQLTYYSALSYLVLVVVRGVQAWRGGKGPVGLRRPLVFFGLMCVIGLGLSAPQWIASLKFLAECKRSAGLSLAEVKTGTLSLGQLWCAFTGGTGWPEDAETTAYIGLFPLFLAIFAALAGRQRGLGAYRIIALGSILLMLSALTPFFYYWFPLYRHFHDPKRMLGMLTVIASLFAACGMYRLWEIYSRGLRRDRIWTYIACGTLWVIKVMASVFRRGEFEPYGFGPEYRVLGWITMSNTLIVTLVVLACMGIASLMLLMLLWLLKRRSPLAGAFAVVLLACPIIVFYFALPHGLMIEAGNLIVIAGSLELLRLWLRRPRSAFFPVLLLILIAFSTTVFSFARIDLKFISAGKVFQSTSLNEPIVHSEHQGRFLSYDDGIHYSYDYTRDAFGEYLLPNVGSYFGLEDFQGYDPAIPHRYAAYLDLINRGFVRLYTKHFGIVRNLGSPLLDRASVRYIIGDAESYVPFMHPQTLKEGESLNVRLEMPGPFSAIMLWAIQEPFLHIPKGQEVGSINCYADDKLVERFPLRFGLDVGDGQMRGTPVGESVNQEGTRFCDFVRDRGALFFATEFPLSPAKLLTHVTVEWTWGRGSSLVVKQVTLQPIAWTQAVEMLKEERIRTERSNVRLQISERKSALPRVHMATQIIRAGSPNEAAQNLAALGLGDDYAVIVEAEVKDAPLPSKPGGGKILQTTFRTNQVEIKVECDEPGGFLVLRDAFFSGWRATVDNEPAKIYPTDLMFRGIMVPKGTHVVRFVYRPPEIMYALVIMLATLGGVVAYLLLERRMRGNPLRAD